MSIFTRFKDIISSNINDILDQAEDPEKMTRLMIREMEDTLVELKSSCSKSIAVKTKTEREKQDLELRMNRWEERAKLALEKDRDDLAKEALLEKQACQNQLDILNNDINHYTRMIEECKSNIAQLEERLDGINQKYRLLVQRGKHARETKKTHDMIYNSSGANAVRRFDELENRIERMEAQAEMSMDSTRGRNLDSEFSKLESESKIDEELAAMKKKMKAKSGQNTQGKPE